ncbi:hypothetical protein ACS0TY_009918 [Phlomoides rotata]
MFTISPIEFENELNYVLYTILHKYTDKFFLLSCIGVNLITNTQDRARKRRERWRTTYLDAAPFNSKQPFKNQQRHLIFEEEHIASDTWYNIMLPMITENKIMGGIIIYISIICAHDFQNETTINNHELQEFFGILFPSFVQVPIRVHHVMNHFSQSINIAFKRLSRSS